MIGSVFKTLDILQISYSELRPLLMGKRSTTISIFSIFCFIVCKDHTTLSFGHIPRFFVCYESNYKSGTTLVFSHSVAKCKQHYAADCSVVFGLVLFHTNQRSWWGLYQLGMPPWAGWLWAVWAVLGSCVPSSIYSWFTKPFYLLRSRLKFEW